MESEKGREKPAEAKRYQKIRRLQQVHDIHKYFQLIKSMFVKFILYAPLVTIVSVFDSFVCRFWVWAIFFAVLQFWIIFSSVLRFLIYPNAPSFI